jgi:hypothetical protein
VNILLNGNHSNQSNHIQSNQSCEDYIYNINEIPIVLQSNKPRKQLGSINNDMIQVKPAHLTRTQNIVVPQLLPLLQVMEIIQYG